MQRLLAAQRLSSRLLTAFGLATSLTFVGCALTPELILGEDDGVDSSAGGNSTDGSNNDDSLVVPVDDGGDGSDDGNPTPAVCGNGELETGELCDDGDEEDGDGCSADCSEVDPHFFCETPGEACVRVVTCGNGLLEGDEACDDDNEEDDDGCAGDCSEIEAGFSCIRPGEPCSELPVCGNGVRERGEGCDDGQSTPTSDDGCSATCQIEDPDAWHCPPGHPCIAKACGNGVRTPDEACEVGPGCTAECEVEDGYRCSASGCKPICGDGKIKGAEACDDGGRSNGDGCSSVCTIEAFFECDNTPPPSVCTTTIVCGNGVVDPGEVCDPPSSSGNPDGCLLSGPTACKAFDNELVDPAVCGNGVLELGEACDGDGIVGVDVCLDDCTEIEPGYACPGANYCFRIPACGDGIVQPGEECDVGALSAVSCDQCEVQPGYYCTGTEPSVCVAFSCGDGVRAPNEACDDDGNDPGDGCSETCTVEPGWVCPPVGACKPICGDGVVTAPEQCEGTTGCTNCKINSGYDCGVNGLNCVQTRCGNGVVERGEGCDNDTVAVGVAPIAGDGCGATCQSEPVFSGWPNAGPRDICGDGLISGAEVCDDGNQLSGDGCKGDCSGAENGWTCTAVTNYPAAIKLKMTYRDFKQRSEVGGHPQMRVQGVGPPDTTTTDFGIAGAQCTNANFATCGRLDSEGKPALTAGPHPDIGQNIGNTSSPGYIYHAAAYALWYRDTNAAHVKDKDGVVDIAMANTTGSISLDRDTSDLLNHPGKYAFTSTAFFPIDNQLHGNTPGQSHNYHFSSEMRYFFKYARGQELRFLGDDDLLVFINGRLAIDSGGMHADGKGRVVLGDEDTSCTTGTTTACTLSAGELTDTNDARFDIDVGKIYEITVFHAERHPTGSNYRLTLDGFLTPRSYCSTTCGDGIIAGTELCDDGNDPTTGNRNGEYGKCNMSCSYTFCGDGTQQTTQGGNEECDNRTNSNVYIAGTRTTECAPGCKLPGRCGDGVLQPSEEVCDDGVNDGGYGECAAGCQAFDGYCGDGNVSGGEECDAAVKVSYSADGTGCGYDCKWAPSCGDGIRNGEEHCDGSANCNADCHFDPFCGDGLLASSGEACDYGPFAYTGSPASAPYGSCTDECELGPYCGDDAINGPEECDDGDDNIDGEYNQCTTDCAFGPRCGDGIPQSIFGESCDNGFNEDVYDYPGVEDACGPNCTGVPYCGDDVVQAGFELCDNGDASHSGDGDQNDDDEYDGCKTNCEWGPFCGDGHRDGSDDGSIPGPEKCDAGAGNVAYGGTNTQACGFDCQYAPYCGDGQRNGPEQCDQGTAHNDGKYGSCKSNCTFAPRCGDGKIDKGHEACDDGPTGSLKCSPTCQVRGGIK